MTGRNRLRGHSPRASREGQTGGGRSLPSLSRPSDFRKANPHLSDAALALAYALQPPPVLIGIDWAKQGDTKEPG